MMRSLALVATSLVLAVSACTPNPTTTPVITLTLVRHGQSQGNASGLIDSSVPGPPLTERGSAQAVDVARLLGTDHDGVFASTMVRTQQTAAPLAAELHESVTVLAGLREVEAGAFEGRPEASAAKDYYRVVTDWVNGRRDERIPGSIDGNELDTRFDQAVQAIYATRDTRPVAFSHGAAIAAWTLMNADNGDPALMATPLPNTGVVVLTGNPRIGWRITEWNGEPIP